MRTKFITILTFFYLLLSSHFSSATAYIPNDNDVVAPSHSLLKATLSFDEIKTLVLNSQYVGQTERLQGLLKPRLAAMYSQTPNAEIGYLYARVLQKEHKFNEAIAIANSVLKTDSTHSNTHLLLANMLMINGDLTQAKQHCTALIGQVSIITTTTCVVDVQSQQNEGANLEQSYQSLLKITKNKTVDLYTAQVLSEMAYRLHKYEQALTHISKFTLDQAPVSLIALWADIQLGMNHHQQVLTHLSPLLDNTDNLEDALLLRLAIAEKRADASELARTQLTPQKTLSKQWQTLITKRVELRELRQDSFHASDLAKYYSELTINPDKAIYWAEINLKQAKMTSDKLLLKNAKELKAAL